MTRLEPWASLANLFILKLNQRLIDSNNGSILYMEKRADRTKNVQLFFVYFSRICEKLTISWNVSL